MSAWWPALWPIRLPMPDPVMVMNIMKGPIFTMIDPPLMDVPYQSTSRLQLAEAEARCRYDVSKQDRSRIDELLVKAY